jgi:hypothetical protein
MHQPAEQQMTELPPLADRRELSVRPEAFGVIRIV